MKRGFTLIELMIVVAIIAILAVVAVPQFHKWHRHTKIAEATKMLDIIKKGSATYYRTPRTQKDTDIKVLCQFPKKVGTTPSGVNCCIDSNDSDNDERCDSKPGAWNDPSWSALEFVPKHDTLSDQHYFQYSYNSSGTLASAKYTAEANADLDCDQILSTFQMVGKGDTKATQAKCDAVGTSAIFRDNELE